jgi:hypothetical protein
MGASDTWDLALEHQYSSDESSPQKIVHPPSNHQFKQNNYYFFFDMFFGISQYHPA